MIMKYLCCSSLLVIHINNESILLPHIQIEVHFLYALKHQNTLIVNTDVCQRVCRKSCDCLCGTMSTKYRKIVLIYHFHMMLIHMKPFYHSEFNRVNIAYILS